MNWTLVAFNNLLEEVDLAPHMFEAVKIHLKTKAYGDQPKQ